MSNNAALVLFVGFATVWWGFVLIVDRLGRIAATLEKIVETQQDKK